VSWPDCRLEELAPHHTFPWKFAALRPRHLIRRVSVDHEKRAGEGCQLQAMELETCGAANRCKPV